MRKPTIVARIVTPTNFKYVMYRINKIPYFGGSSRIRYKLHMKKLYTRHYVGGLNLKRRSVNKHIGSKGR